MRNLHATALVVGSKGVLITGASGSGKSRLAHALHLQCGLLHLPCLLVSDDQVLPEAKGKHLVVRAPAEISGLIEMRGFGLAAARNIHAAVMDLAVELVAREQAERMPDDDAATQICGVSIGKLTLPREDAAGSALAILARLGHSVWSEQSPA